ncbi:MAG: enoyl-CoA hydratase/isomerase family protein [Alphaproteobacteria bacterium]|nr:enoyl-CoA hydratase/isomerase family protein [Alphaproteobacteria bacterium]
MSEENVVTLARDGAVAIITIDRPAALNAINAAVLDGLAAVLDTLEADAGVRCAVLAGAGGKAFVAGADIVAMSTLGAVEAERFAGRGQAILNRIAGQAFPVIAAVGGFALGGGCELAMACDLVIAGEKAKFGQPEVNLGVIPGFGGTQRLVRRVGMSAALDLCLTGRIVGADEAVRMGLASQKVEGDVLEAALGIAKTIASKGPVAVRLCKRAIHENADGALDSAQAAERSLFGLCFATADQKEGMAAFIEKRAAAFTGA